MVFSSITFLLYFLPFFLLCYYLFQKKYRNLILILFSVFFYSWGAPKFIFVILGTTLLDFALVKKMHTAVQPTKRKIFLCLSLSVNLGLLFYFKYFNFFIDNINSMLSVFGNQPIHLAKLILPIGISFYTFETITYVVDVYRKVHAPLAKFWDYLLYIILFPKLIAGPIIRYHDIADQITDRSANETVDNRLSGFYRFAIGLAKKVLIANQMGLVADAVFSMNYLEINTYTAWVGILAYTFQIYFDFSGYSDMAIGLARMIGFKFSENFDNPYTSKSITEFWRRWHISLGTWMRNYLYIPLGGNRVSSKRIYFNLWIVFLASGLWHGASWNFVIWGAYHGLFLVVERSVFKKYDKVPGVVLTFLIVVIGWVFFRTESTTDAFHFLNRMFSFDFNNSFSFDSEFYTFFSVALFFSFFTLLKIGQRIHNRIFSQCYSIQLHLTFASVSILLFYLCVSSITSSNFNPFIYFRF